MYGPVCVCVCALHQSNQGEGRNDKCESSHHARAGDPLWDSSHGPGAPLFIAAS